MRKSSMAGILCALVMGATASAQNLAKVTPGTAADIANLQPVIQYQLPWASVTMGDLKWIKRVWREIDLNDAANELLTANKGKSTGLFETLIKGASEGLYGMYDVGNDRFTTRLENEERKRIAAAAQTGSVSKYRIKEDWLCFKTDGHIEVRILGIAPVVTTIAGGGTTEDKTLCWFYYPDARAQLAAVQVPAAYKNKAANWDEVFQLRKFNAPVQKVTHRE